MDDEREVVTCVFFSLFILILDVRFLQTPNEEFLTIVTDCFCAVGCVDSGCCIDDIVVSNSYRSRWLFMTKRDGG
jgi:hypothetical protein